MISRVLTALAVLVLTSCAETPSRLPAPASEAPRPPAVTQTLPTIDLFVEIERLRRAMAKEVPGSWDRISDDETWQTLSLSALADAGIMLDRPQLVVVVDRNPAVQRLRVMLAEPSGQWRTIGGGKVSTGQAGRRGYFLTPTGVFEHSAAILDYRALGTLNENGIRGLGTKDMRVWDFGWQMAEPGCGTDREPRQIRLQLHATDPDLLEPRLGRPASKGCIRISSAMNRFLDTHGILDAAYEQEAATNPAIAHLLLENRTPTPLAGTLLIVIDSHSPAPNDAGPTSLASAARRAVLRFGASTASPAATLSDAVRPAANANPC